MRKRRDKDHDHDRDRDRDRKRDSRDRDRDRDEFRQLLRETPTISASSTYDDVRATSHNGGMMGDHHLAYGFP